MIVRQITSDEFIGVGGKVGGGGGLYFWSENL